jgi:hypothetical protein
MDMRRTLLALLAFSTVVAFGPMPPAGAIQGTTSGNYAPSWQTNGTVWALASANGVVYLGGDFTSVRPPGVPAGTGEVTRNHLAAFDAGTGQLMPNDFMSHSLNDSIKALAVSPDGATLYAGGDFTSVDSTPRIRLVAFSTLTGAMLPWAPAANDGVQAIDVSADSTTIYVGGGFSLLDNVGRPSVGAIGADGSLLPLSASIDGAITTLALANGGARLLVGGYFDHLNGQSYHAIGSLDPTTGATQSWAATVVPSCSAVKIITTDPSTGNVFVGGEGTGGGCFDGTFSAEPVNGTLRWQDNCLGATQALAVIGGYLYVGSHAHDCGQVPGGYDNVGSGSGKAKHLLTESTVDGSFGPWFANTNGNALGPRVMATDGSQLFLGGDFTFVNAKAQRGFTRFSAGPDTTAPKKPVAPTVISTAAGAASLSWPAVTDLDDATLTYKVFRDGGLTPIATLIAYSIPWTIPMVRYRDAGLTPGSTHTYQVRVSDGPNQSAKSPASAPVTIASSDPALSYPATVLSNAPYLYWRLGELVGTTAADSTGNNRTGVYVSGYAQGASGAIPGDPDTAVSLDGASGLIRSNFTTSNPQNFTEELWFNTSTRRGGKLIGLGSAPTGLSGNYDRHVFMNGAGNLIFGIWNGRVNRIKSPLSYNDGQWHHLVAVWGSSGMALYVDGVLIGTNPTTAAQSYSGYWRVGYDNLCGWTDNENHCLAPPSYWLAGSVDEIAIYSTQLNASQVAAHYAANVLSH